MKRSSRNWLVAAAVLIVLGMIFFGMVFALTGCEKLRPEPLVTNTSFSRRTARSAWNAMNPKAPSTRSP